MKKMQALEAQKALDKLNSGIDHPWALEAEALVKEFVFKDFNQAFAFMTALALYAEKVDHHPDWRNCYRRVGISMSTFDVQGITQQDFSFAAMAEQVATQSQ